jgi:5-methyltetrahydrofolate--homocysteine methyltransferase
MDTIPLPLPSLLDGATGTRLQEAGMPPGICTEQWILENPEILTGIQKEYVAAGSRIVCAPTFGANRAALERHGLAGQVEEFNLRLAKLTQDAVGGRALVAGDLAPTGLFVYPFGNARFEELVEIYREQVRGQLAAGVDLFFLETFTTLTDARAAVLAVRENSKKPVIASMTCGENGRMLSGTDVTAAMIVMQGMGVSAFGLNCCTGPDLVMEQIRRLSPYRMLPLIAKPNAGLPKVVEGKTIFDSDPEIFGSYAKEWAELGVRFFGGCCGSDARHIAALRAALSEIDFSVLPQPEQDPDLIACASEREACFISPTVDVGEEIICGPDFAEDILDSENNVGAIKVVVRDEDDLEIFEENQYMIRDALCISAYSPEILEKTVRCYQGRAFYDGTDDFEPDFLANLSEKYGLVVL